MAEHDSTTTPRKRKSYPPINPGDVFGSLRVLSAAPDRVSPNGSQTRRWLTVCECGRTSAKEQSKLYSGQSRHCGCQREFQDFSVGQVFGLLTVTGPSFKKGKQWKTPCKCQCGADTLPFAFSLSSGKTRSCGKCIRVCSDSTKQAVSAANTKHGWRNTPEYLAWINMRKRCNNPTNRAYRNYGARGIKVCPEWQDNFEAFLSHIGPRPSPELSIDRIDNSRGYEPGNVRWADRSTQSRNRRPFMIVPGSRSRP